MLNYPLKFHPILKDKIWGGDKLVQELKLGGEGLPPPLPIVRLKD